MRIYRLRPETADEFVRLWERDIVPLRRSMGFRVVGAWREREEGEFVWIVGWDGPQAWAEADRAYYDNPARASMGWDPADYIESSELRLLDSVEGFAA